MKTFSDVGQCEGSEHRENEEENHELKMFKWTFNRPEKENVV